MVSRSDLLAQVVVTLRRFPRAQPRRDDVSADRGRSTRPLARVDARSAAHQPRPPAPGLRSTPPTAPSQSGAGNE